MTAQLYYEKALRCYLLTKHIPAANNCLKAIASSKTEVVAENLLSSIWTLYINIATTLLITSASKEQIHVQGLIDIVDGKGAGSLQDTCYRLWKKVTDEGYGGDVSTIQSNVISVCLAMAMKMQQPSTARNIAEEWFAALPEHVLQEVAEGKDKAGYNDIVDQYITRILPSMNDFDSAVTFLDYNTVLSDSRKKTLRALLAERKQSIELDRERKTRLEEEARKLALEEKRRAEEEEKLRQEQEEELKRQKEAEEREAEQSRIKEQLLEAQKEKEAAEEAELKRKEDLSLHSRFGSTSSSSNSSYSSSIQTENKTMVQKWMDRFSNVHLSKTSGGILLFIFALFALLRGQRGRLSIALQHFMYKLWETLKMGTKVTYI